MVKDIRLKRLERVALERASQVVLYELSDPRLTLVTLTRVELSNDLSHATIRWSVLGTEADRNKCQRALDDAVSVVQGEVAKVFHTRRSPRLRFAFDPSIEGAVRMGGILNKLAQERGEEPTDPAQATPDAPDAPDATQSATGTPDDDSAR